MTIRGAKGTTPARILPARNRPGCCAAGAGRSPRAKPRSSAARQPGSQTSSYSGTHPESVRCWRCRGPPPVPVFSPWLSSVAPGSHGGSDPGVGCRCTRDRPPAARFRQALSQVAAGSPASSGAASRAFPRLSPVWVPRPPVFPWAWLSFWRSIIGLLFPALRPTSPAQGGRSKPPNSPSNTPPHPSPPCRGSRVVPVAVPPRRPCLPGRTPAPHSLCRLSPCAGGCGPRGLAQEPRWPAPNTVQPRPLSPPPDTPNPARTVAASPSVGQIVISGSFTSATNRCNNRATCQKDAGHSASSWRLAAVSPQIEPTQN